jgi:short-subunit dehydrogenase
MARRILKNAVAVVTGAASGIGRHIALQLADAGCNVLINSRRAERVEQLQTEIRAKNVSAKSVIGDITLPETQKKICETAAAEFGRIDILVNNAGIGAVGYFAEASPDRLRKIMEVNFFAATELTRIAIPLLKKSDAGIIVNVSSVLGHRAVPLKSEYCASKFAIHGWSDSLRAELAKDNIDVLLVSPSTTDSEFFDSVIEDTSGKNPTLSKPMPPEKVARATLRAIQKGKSEVILSPGGLALVWLDRICPPLANRLMKKFAQ